MSRGDNYWAGEWPNLNSISVVLPIFMQWTLSPASVGILYRLVMHVGAKSVHSAYSGPDPDPKLPPKEADIRKIACCSRKEWKDCLPWFEELFFAAPDGWRLKDEQEVLRLSRPNQRNPLSAVAKSIVMSRDGQRCAYCGTLEGPFHFDHIFPVSRGGSDHATNLVLACVPCNMSKGSKTLAEWVGRS